MLQKGHLSATFSQKEHFALFCFCAQQWIIPNTAEYKQHQWILTLVPPLATQEDLG